MKYVIGIDYGTLSGRTVLVDTETGKEVSEATLSYAHGVMDEKLPCGKKLPANYALQHPNDYLEVLKQTVKEVLNKSKVSANEVVGIGIVCRGGSDPKIQRELLSLVSAACGVGSNRIFITEAQK